MFGGENKRQKILALLTMCFALFMAMLDNTVVNVALPTLSRDLGAGVSDLQWIVDGYVLAFASLLLTGGILGDRYGRKRAFMAGLVIFTISSLMCGLSDTTQMLIIFRALQGIGGALLIPGTLSILTVTFPPSERAQALGIWAGVSGVALALGPTLGGYMIEHVGWESVFFLNVPIGVIGLAVAARVITESRAPHARRLDVPGLAIGTSALFSITYGLIGSNQRGWTHPITVGTLVAGAGLLVAFFLWERHSPDAMMPLAMFRIRAFSAGNTVAFAISFGMFGAFFFMSLYMQMIRGYSPVESGIRFLPMTGMIIVAAPLAGRFASRLGSRLPITIGMLLAATGQFLISRISADTPFALITPLLMIMGVGMGMTMAPMTAAVMNAVGAERAGLGSATTNTSREVGGVFGVALLGSLLTTRLKSSLGTALAAAHLPAAQYASIVEGAGHGRIDPSLFRGMAPQQIGLVTQSFGNAFLDGFQLALLVGSIVLAAAALVAFAFIPHGAPTHHDHEHIAVH
ncbi:MAG: MFS transporter [Actinomycetota bacterium]